MDMVREADVVKELPLAGVRVLEFCWYGAGPLSASFLGRMGAEVIKVESKRFPDFTRNHFCSDGISGVNRGGVFQITSVGKKSCSIDLSNPKGAEILKRLIKVSNLFIETFGSRTMRKLGLDYETLRKLKPDLVMISISGFGATGPKSNYVAYGHNLDADCGLTDLIGYPDGPPRGLTPWWADAMAAMTACYAAVTALYHHRETGIGQHVDLAMSEAVIAGLPEPILDYIMNQRNWNPSGNKSNFAAPHNCYPCQGRDKWIAITVSDDCEWEALCKAIGNPEWTKREKFSDALSRWKNQDELDALLSKWTMNHTPHDAMVILQGAGVPAGPTWDTQEVANNENLNQRRFFIDTDHPETGRRKGLGLPWRLTGSPHPYEQHAPLLGQHNAYVLQELLGMSEEEVSRLTEEKIIY